MDRAQQLIRNLDAWALQHSWARVWRGAILGFFEHDTLQYAGSMAYFAMLSIFQVLILAVVLLATLVGEGQARELLLERLTDVGSPIDPQTVENLIDATLEASGTLTLIGVGFLLWSALGLFASLSRGVGRVFDAAPPDLFAWDMVRGTLLMLLAGAFAVGAVAIGFVADLIQRFAAEALAEIPGAEIAVALVGALLPLLMAFVAFYVLYRVVPTTKVHVMDALSGALVATVLWTVLRIGFMIYATYFVDPVSPFGVVSTAITLLIFLYFGSLVVLAGAEFAHASGVERSERGSAAMAVRPDPSSAPGG